MDTDRMTGTARTNAMSGGPTLSRGRPATRSRAEQIREARRIAQLAKDMARALENPVEPTEEQRTGCRSLYYSSELEAKLTWAQALTADAETLVKKALAHQKMRGPLRRVAVAPDPLVLQSLDSDFPNFAPVTATIRKRPLVCRLAPEQLLEPPPMLLDGPPGIGKSSYCLRLEKLFGIRFEAIDISKGGSDFAMVGRNAGYSSSRPGRILDSLSGESMSVLWMLDEVDKKSQSLRDSGVNYLLGLLEPVTASRFMDNAMLVPIDTRWIWFVATCNDKTQVPSPLLSRFEVFDIAVPTAQQVRAVVFGIFREPANKTDETLQKPTLICI
jgi:hypothetical protein